MKKSIKAILLLSILFGMFSTGAPALAADNIPAVRFDVTADIPADQVANSTLKEINLKLTPGQTENLTYHITNNTADELVFSISTGTATTLTNGKVHYVTDASSVSTTLPAKVGDMIKIDKLVTVPAKATVDVPATLTTPETEFNGQLIGGISFTDVKSKESSQIPLYVAETDEVVKPVASVDGAKFYLPATKRILQLQLSNSESMIINDLKLTTKLTSPEGKTVFTKKNQKVSLVPNAQADINLKTNLVNLKAGVYKLKVTVNDGKHKQVTTRDVKISAALAKQLSTKASTQSGYTAMDWFWMIFWPVVAFLVVFFGGRFLLPKRHARKGNPDLKKNSSAQDD